MTNNSDISVKLEDILELYYLMEELQDFFHQPMYYRDIDKIQKFVDNYYPSIHKAYYQTLWNLLPKKEKDQITDS